MSKTFATGSRQHIGPAHRKSPVPFGLPSAHTTVQRTRVRDIIHTSHVQAQPAVRPIVPQSSGHGEHIDRMPLPQNSTPAPAAGSTSTTPPTVVRTSSGPMQRSEFEERMRSTYGVSTVRTGTLANQNAELTGELTASQWQSWDPGTSSIVYRHIVDAFDEFTWTFGGVPRVTTVTFYQMYYERGNTGLVPNADVGASYGGGTMNVYSRIDSTARLGLPFARSVASGSYPGAPVLVTTGPGLTPGAPVGFPSSELGVKRIIWHELGHGLVETAAGPCGTTAPPDPTIMSDYRAAIGWHGGKLYDIGNAGVRADLAAGRTPAANLEITASDWNHPRWREQPISAYMVSEPGEDFAEAVRAYIEKPALLQSRSPERHRFIGARLHNYVRCLRQIQRPGDYPPTRPDSPRLA